MNSGCRVCVVAVACDACEGIGRGNGIDGGEFALLDACEDLGIATVVEDVLLPCFVDDGERCNVLCDGDSVLESLKDDGVARMVEEHEYVWFSRRLWPGDGCLE